MDKTIVKIRATKNFRLKRVLLIGKGNTRFIPKHLWDSNNFWTSTRTGDLFGACTQEGWELVDKPKCTPNENYDIWMQLFKEHAGDHITPQTELCIDDIICMVLQLSEVPCSPQYIKNLIANR